MNAIMKPDVPGAALVPVSLSDAIRLAEMMAQARIVPRHLQGSPGDCLLVIEQAMRWQMSPFAVAQATSVISGKMMFEGKLVAAAVETSGAIVGHIDYAFSGQGADRAVTVSATRRGETEPRQVTVTLREARTDNSMWQRQPDQQLCYHGARVWARRWTPAVILGVYSREEMGKVIDAVPETEAAPEGEAVREPPTEPAPAAEETQAPPPASLPSRKLTAREWLDELEVRLRAAQTGAEVDAIIASREVNEARQKLRNGAKDALEGLITDAYDRLQAAADEAAEAAIEEPEMSLP